MGFEFLGGDFENVCENFGELNGGVDLTGRFEETLDTGEFLLEFDYVVE